MCKIFSSAFFALILVLNSQSFAKTSLTDESAYAAFCFKAANTPHLFNQFKSFGVYSGIVETVSYTQGREYLNFIVDEYLDLLQLLPSFKENDRYGGPTTYFYPETGQISPTTLRYIKTLGDLKRNFGSLEDCTIVEIGGGYGGQCKILWDLFHFKHYIIIDLPGPQELTKKYLDLHGIRNVTFLSPYDPLPVSECDLVISNYAFSECITTMQNEYFEKVIARAKKGYLVCNLPSSEGEYKGIYSPKKDIMKSFSEAGVPWEEFPEIPLTCKNNYLMIWGHR